MPRVTSSEPTEPLTVNLGLRSWIANVANLGAVAIICILFYNNMTDQSNMIKEERKAYREDLKASYEANMKLSESIRAINTSVSELTREIRDLRHK